MVIKFLLTEESAESCQNGWDQVHSHVAVAEKSSHLQNVVKSAVGLKSGGYIEC